jgi:hypothetical protein
VRFGLRYVLTVARMASDCTRSQSSKVRLSVTMIVAFSMWLARVPPFSKTISTSVRTEVVIDETT